MAKKKLAQEKGTKAKYKNEKSWTRQTKEKLKIKQINYTHPCFLSFFLSS